MFGPVTLVWSLCLAVLGVRGILTHPSVLAALLPTYAFRFFAVNGLGGAWILGAVFLGVTGGEALYADMGHFGQGALLIARPEAIESPFFLLAPGWALYPLVSALERTDVETIAAGIHRVELAFGFREEPDVPAALRAVSRAHPSLGLNGVEKASYFLGTERIVSGRGGMPRWRDAIFSFLARNACEATSFFCIPHDRVVELGARIEI